jgi:SAM-dependent methyltransferase
MERWPGMAYLNSINHMMTSYRAFVKDIFYKIRLANVLDYLVFRSTYYRNRKKNAKYREMHPSAIIPPDYFLYETYRLDYEQFFVDGEETAREIMLWTSGYFDREPRRILDWGCGVSRVAVHVHKFATPGASVYACDVNEQMIEFNRRHYKDILYAVEGLEPPTRYESESFDLIYGLSVFTHIKASIQEAWIKELHRILSDGGILFFTTQGNAFISKLLAREKDIYELDGVFTKSYKKEGHRMMSTYNSGESVRRLVAPYFEVLEFHDGADVTKAGGQDLWIVRKKVAEGRPEQGGKYSFIV